MIHDSVSSRHLHVATNAHASMVRTQTTKDTVCDPLLSLFHFCLARCSSVSLFDIKDYRVLNVLYFAIVAIRQIYPRCFEMWIAKISHIHIKVYLVWLVKTVKWLKDYTVSFCADICGVFS